MYSVKETCAMFIHIISDKDAKYLFIKKMEKILGAPPSNINYARQPYT